MDLKSSVLPYAPFVCHYYICILNICQMLFRLRLYVRSIGKQINAGHGQDILINNKGCQPRS